MPTLESLIILRVEDVNDLPNLSPDFIGKCDQLDRPIKSDQLPGLLSSIAITQPRNVGCYALTFKECWSHQILTL
jgi:hypothetical protein